MYPASFEYHSPATLKDALGLMGKLGDDAKLVAGGHSLIPMMKLRLAQPKHHSLPAFAGRQLAPAWQPSQFGRCEGWCLGGELNPHALADIGF